MTEFVLDGFSCRAEGSGDVLVMLFSGFDEQLFREVCGLVPDCRCVLAEFGEIDWDRDYSPWEASSGGRRFSGGAERLLAFLPDFTAELEKRFGRFGACTSAAIHWEVCSRFTRTRSGTNRGSAAPQAAQGRHGFRAGLSSSGCTRSGAGYSSAWAERRRTPPIR